MLENALTEWTLAHRPTGFLQQEEIRGFVRLDEHGLIRSDGDVVPYGDQGAKTEGSALGELKRFWPPGEGDGAEPQTGIRMGHIAPPSELGFRHSGRVQHTRRQINPDRNTALSSIVHHGGPLSESGKSAHNNAAVALHEGYDPHGAERVGI